MCWLLLLGRNFASYLNHWAQKWLQRESHEWVFLAQYYPTFSQILLLLGPGLMIVQCSGLPGSQLQTRHLHANIFLHSEIKPNIKVMQWLQQQNFHNNLPGSFFAINPQQTAYWVNWAKEPRRSCLLNNGRRTNDNDQSQIDSSLSTNFLRIIFYHYLVFSLGQYVPRPPCPDHFMCPWSRQIIRSRF